MGSFSDTYNDPENVPSAVRCRHPRFRNLNSTLPVDVPRAKSYVNTVKFRKSSPSKYKLLKLVTQKTLS